MRVVTFSGGDATVLPPHMLHTNCTASVASGGPSSVSASGAAPTPLTATPSAASTHVAVLLAAASTREGAVAAPARQVQVAAAPANVATPGGNSVATAATVTLSYASTTTDVDGTNAKLTFATATAMVGSRTRSPVGVQVHSAYSASPCPSCAAAAVTSMNATAADVVFSSVTLPAAVDRTSRGDTVSSDWPSGMPASAMPDAGASSAMHDSETATVLALKALLPAPTNENVASGGASGSGTTTPPDTLVVGSQSACHSGSVTTGLGWPAVDAVWPTASMHVAVSEPTQPEPPLTIKPPSSRSV